MTPTNRLLLLAGSVRSGSLNQQLIDVAARHSEVMGIGVTPISLRDYLLPIHEMELDSRIFPEAAQALKAQFQSHSGVLIASPELNGSPSSMLLNALSWMSISTGDEAPMALTAFRGKAFGLMSASPSPFGGMRGLSHLRHVLTCLQGVVVPDQLTLPNALQGFDDSGLVDGRCNLILGQLIGATARMTKQLNT